MFKGKGDKGGGVRLAPKCKLRAEGLVHYFGSNDRNGRGNLSRKKKRGRLQTTAFQLVVEI